MARPRVFISSTYYDLRLIRSDLERFLKELNYDPILFERGHIPYGKEAPLEDYCYREINTCDIVVTIIGGKFGTISKNQQNLITQNELKIALDLNKQVYIFIEKSVSQEFRTYQINKELDGFRTSAVDNIRIYQFIEELYQLPFNNPIESFESSGDIILFLKEQWAGLFQRLLLESSKVDELKLINDIKSISDTLKQTVKFLLDERKNSDDAIKNILSITHPAFNAIKQVANIPYRVIFFSIDELNDLLKARGYKFFDFENKNYYEWDHDKLNKSIHVQKSIFDADGELNNFTPDEWNNKWIVETEIDYDDDIPF